MITVETRASIAGLITAMACTIAGDILGIDRAISLWLSVLTVAYVMLIVRLYPLLTSQKNDSRTLGP